TCPNDKYNEIFSKRQLSGPRRGLRGGGRGRATCGVRLRTGACGRCSANGDAPTRLFPSSAAERKTVPDSTSYERPAGSQGFPNCRIVGRMRRCGLPRVGERDGVSASGISGCIRRVIPATSGGRVADERVAVFGGEHSARITDRG